MSYRVLLIEMSPSGGLFQFGFQLGRSLAVSGNDVTVLTGPRPELRSDHPRLRLDESLPTWHAGEDQVSTTWYRRARRLVRALRHAVAMIAILRAVRRDRPDVIFFQPLRFVLDAWVVRACRLVRPGARRVIVLHEPRPLNEHRRSGSLYKEESWDFVAKRRAVHAMDLIFVLGEKTEREAHAVWSPPCPVLVVPHGDEAVFRHQSALTPVRETAPVVLFFGVWTRHKGIEVLLEAFAAVRSRVADARLLVCGSVTSAVDLASLTRRARQVPGVELRPGYVGMSEVPALFSDARVVVVPYLRASQSGVVHLAQTFERPVVASAVGDIPEAVPDGVAGLVVPPGDAQALARAVERLLDDAELAHRLGEQGHARLVDSGSWDEVAKRVADGLDQLGTVSRSRRKERTK